MNPVRKKILVIGNGQLGKSIKLISSKYKHEFIFANRHNIDLESENSINSFFRGKTFDLIINCAAYTQVDEANLYPDVANQINHLAVKQIAELAKKKNIKLIHISTDYVFDGNKNKPYVETDKTNPINTYGKSKLNGEFGILDLMPENALIIRTSWLYSEYGKNFLKTMLHLSKEKKCLKIINDQFGTPTYAVDLAEIIMLMVENHCFKINNFESNIFHYSNEGECTWYEFAESIFELNNISINIQAIKSEDFMSSVSRPKYTVMSKDKIKEHLQTSLPNWKSSLKRCLITMRDKPL